MRAELGAFLRVERAFQQRAEDRGLDLGPVLLRCLDQHLQLVELERDRRGVLEQVAVEALDRDAQRRRELAAVHRAPQGGELVVQMLRVIELPAQQRLEAVRRQQHAGILGEHREQHPAEEAADRIRRMAARFEPPRDGGEQIGDLARDARRLGRGIERCGLSPDRRQPLPHAFVAQIVEHDAVARPIGKLRIGLPGAGEVGIDFDAIADIGNQQERRPAVVDRQRLGVALGLALGLHDRLCPTRRATPRGTALQTCRCGLAEQVEVVLTPLRRGAVGFASLFGFEDESAAFVTVDPSEADGAVAIVLEHAALEDIVVLRVIGAAATRRLDPNQAAQCVYEALRVG